jgi:16S rRNA (cytosine1402-N4)-methyltransferase
MHQPVLLEQVIKFLDPKPGENFVDCTLGDAGHTKAILEKNKPDGKVLGIDLDASSLERIEPQSRLILVHDNFRNFKKIVEDKNFKPINGVLFDLGISSWQIEESGRGFTFKKDEPLIMILDNKQEVTAQEILNTWPEESLIEIFKKYGQEKYSRRIVTAIVNQRKITPIKTTFQLKELVKKAIIPGKTPRGRLDRVLARIFQALRIVINDEVEAITESLEQAIKIITPKARIVVISFHSLEDRIVKNFFKNKERKGRLKILTKKPVVADEMEISNNPRARSAKLRAIIKT